MHRIALDVLKELLKDRLDISEEAVTPDVLLSDIGIDSLMQIE